MAAQAVRPVPDRRQHGVQFYEHPEEMRAPLTGFIKEGLARKESIVLIVTPTLWKSLRRNLGKTVDWKRLVKVDAQSVLERILVDGSPDPQRFEALVQEILSSLGGNPFRAFGEAVDLLAREGNFEAAIRLEELWNRLLLRHSFPLYCAYDVRVFYKAMRGSEYRHLRAIHDHVLSG